MNGIVLFLKCLAVGFTVAAPLGPVGTICINRTLHRGFPAGIAAGVGSAAADTCLAMCAAVGLEAFTSFLSSIDAVLRVGGGLFMIWLGWHSLHPHHSRGANAISKRGLAGTIGGAFILTLANPLTILSFAAIFAALGLVAVSGRADGLLVCAGVFSGAMAWWCTLSGGISLARHRLLGGFGRWAARISGGLIMLFGAGALGSFLWMRLGLG